jgi:hypothetical protein
MKKEVEKYRSEGSHLYELDEASNAYIHCYQNPRTKSLSKLIAEYERADDEDEGE